MKRIKEFFDNPINIMLGMIVFVVLVGIGLMGYIAVIELQQNDYCESIGYDESESLEPAYNFVCKQYSLEGQLIDSKQFNLKYIKASKEVNK